MVTPISNISVNRGLCPHGLPFSACPICSGQGGGGGGSGTPIKTRVMSWDECYAIGQSMKAQAQRTTDEKQFATNSIVVALQNNKTLQAIVSRAATVAAFIQTNISQPIANFANKVFSTITKPFVNLANNIMNSPQFNALKNIAENIQKSMTGVIEKLTAVIGEPMTAVSHFLSENWRKFKPKKFIFLSAVETEMEQGDQDEEIELKRWLHLTSLKENIKKTFKKKKKRQNRWS